MSFVVSGKILVEGAQAKAELAATAAETKKLGTAAGQLDSSARQAATGTRALEGAATAATSDLRLMAQSAAVAEAQNQGLARSGQMAAGSVSNMTAQFNDIFMMIAAGQNPLQLAIQQGTQITQSFGPGGAAGALRMMGAGFMSMLSPINLVTLAGIAAGAAMIQWLTSAGDEVATLSDSVGNLQQAVSDLTEASGQSLEDLQRQFGEITPAVLALRDEIIDLRIDEVFARAEAAAASLKAELSGGLVGPIAPIAELLDRPAGVGGRGGFMVDPGVKAFQTDVDTLIGSDNLQDQLDAVERMQTAIRGARDAQTGFTAEQRVTLTNLVEIEAQLRIALAAQEQKTGAQAEANRQLQEEINALNSKAQIDALIAQYGRDSVQVTTARVQAERDALVASLESSDASESMKQELLDAFDAANGVASVDMAGNISIAADEAGRLARNFEIIDRIRRRQAAEEGDIIYDPRDPRFDPIEAEMARIQEEANRSRTQDSLRSSPVGGASSGGGAASARVEADAVQKLIERKQAELELMRISDPIMREMYRHREALAQATDGQRAQVEGVIAALEREKAVQSASNFFETSAVDFLKGVVRAGGDAEAALDNLIAKLIDAGIEAMLLGTGPLAGVLGISGSIFDFLKKGGGAAGVAAAGAKSFPSLYADGGMIYGAGGPRDDKELILASPGEFMVNARATSRNRELLEFLNSGGTLPRFANGGLIGLGSVGTMPASGGVPAMGGALIGSLSVDARGAQKGVGREVVESLKRDLLPDIEKVALAAMAKATRRGVRL